MSPHVFRERCIFLRKQGRTLTEIAALLGRPKTSIYFHIRSIPHSDMLSERLRRIRSRTAARNRIPKGTSLSGIPFRRFSRWTPELVSLFAHVQFDGAVSRAGVLYHNRQRALLEHFRVCMRRVYAGEPHTYRNSDGTLRLAYHDVALVPFFHEKVRELNREIVTLDVECKRTFLRAFFDDEGSIYFRIDHGKRCVKGSQDDRSLLALVRVLLREFGIQSEIDDISKAIVITRRRNLTAFAHEINFSRGVCINGKRANSIWRRSIEKRVILSRALHSYREVSNL